MEMNAPINLKQGPVELAVVCGSHLYGTSTAASDLDVRGVYLAPNGVLLGLDPKTDTVAGMLTNANPHVDYAYWELAHFVRMAAKGSFTALELLFAPSSHVLVSQFTGTHLRANRELFLTERVRDGLLGFCRGQLKDAINKNSAKPYVHARRVLWTLNQLYHTGTLDFVLPDAEYPKIWRRTWEKDAVRADELATVMAGNVMRRPARFPAEPDMAALNRLVLECRGLFND